MNKEERIVITGVGLTSPIGNTLQAMRESLLQSRSGVRIKDILYMGPQPAGEVEFDPLTYQKRRDLRVGTRAGSIGIFCANEAIRNAGLDWENTDRERVGVYVGTTEHGNVETEHECINIGQFNNDPRYWSHHHNPRTVANNPAGEITVNLGITGPHYAIGAACAAGNAGIIQAVQMLRLGEVDIAIGGGVSESVRSFGIFAGFKSQGALGSHEDPRKASRPFDASRNGIVVSEGGCLYILERLADAEKRGATIIAEIIGYALNSDASDFVLPNPEQQARCMEKALLQAGIEPNQVDLVSSHATSTPQGDIQECAAIRKIFDQSPNTHVNNTKSFIGHAMGAAGSLELAGNLLSFHDNMIHPTINVDELDPQCHLHNLVCNQPKHVDGVSIILNNSFGMLGINSALIVRKF